MPKARVLLFWGVPLRDEYAEILRTIPEDKIAAIFAGTIFEILSYGKGQFAIANLNVAPQLRKGPLLLQDVNEVIPLSMLEELPRLLTELGVPTCPPKGWSILYPGFYILRAKRLTR